MNWKPKFGSWLDGNGASFCVWAPIALSVDVVLEYSDTKCQILPLVRSDDGYFTGFVPNVCAGTKYRYRLDNDRSFPDPASRYQPNGVHGASQVVDPEFNWTDQSWQGISLGDLVIYELHVGTFTQDGTFSAVTEKLPQLKKLGISAIELMPIADFPGNHNWGYDGVDLFAPARCYGTPTDLRDLVNTAHSMGIAVFLDVVYNHFGPDGAYIGAFSPYYFSSKHKSPWGNAVNLDDTNCQPVRDFIIENALYWIHEYHVDGLRLDATHAIIDESPSHIIKDISSAIHNSLHGQRKVLIFAEDDRNLARIVQTLCEDGYGLDGVWADDFHHQIRSLLHGDKEGYFCDFQDTYMSDVVRTMRQGWFFCGQHSAFRNAPRGTDTKGVAIRRFVHCIQNHDQIGNRALGERLHHQIDVATYRAVSALLLCSPATPLIFMGQEWSASSPFCYFTDHHEELGKLVTEGRRNEFSGFKAFNDPEQRHKIPDPQSPNTFIDSKLDWGERETNKHKGVLLLYQAILAIRRNSQGISWNETAEFSIDVIGEDTVAIRRDNPGQKTLLILARLRGKGLIDLNGTAVTQAPANSSWKLMLTTEDKIFSEPALAPLVRQENGVMTLEFFCPAAVIFEVV